MLKRLPAQRIDECLADAACSPMSAAGIEYPPWYLHRWHFLPEGYLSRRSAAMYDAIVRRVYNVACESRLHAGLVRALKGQDSRDLLELGCGPGNGLLAIREALPQARLTGIDLSPFLLELARDRLPDGSANLVHGDATRLPWPDATFDGVVSQHVLGHLPREAAARAWREAARVLRPGGLAYLLEHGWHPRAPGSLLRVGSKPLLGGIVRLDTFRKDG